RRLHRREHPLLEPGRRLGLVGKEWKRVGRLCELADEGAARPTLARVLERFGALGTADDAQGQLRRELANLGARGSAHRRALTRLAPGGGQRATPTGGLGGASPPCRAECPPPRCPPAPWGPADPPSRARAAARREAGSTPRTAGRRRPGAPRARRAAAHRRS